MVTKLQNQSKQSHFPAQIHRCHSVCVCVSFRNVFFFFFLGGGGGTSSLGCPDRF